MTEENRFKLLENMPETYRYTISNQQRDLHFWRIVMPDAITESKQIVSYIDGVLQDFPEGEVYLLSAANHYGASYFMDELVSTGKLEKKADRLYKILR
jgi:hypothetical protein